MGVSSRPTPRYLPIWLEKKIFVPLRTLKNTQYFGDPNGLGEWPILLNIKLNNYGKIKSRWNSRVYSWPCRF